MAGAAATLHRSYTLEVVAHASSDESNPLAGGPQCFRHRHVQRSSARRWRSHFFRHSQTTIFMGSGLCCRNRFGNLLNGEELSVEAVERLEGYYTTASEAELDAVPLTSAPSMDGGILRSFWPQELPPACCRPLRRFLPNRSSRFQKVGPSGLFVSAPSLTV